MSNLFRNIISWLISLYSTTLNATTPIKHSEIEVNIDIVNTNYNLSNIKTAKNINFVNGRILSSENPRFGGWSGMDIDNQGRVILISDEQGIYLKSTDINFTNAKIGKAYLKYGRKDFEELTIVQNKFFDGCLVSNEATNKILYYKKCNFSQNPEEIKTPDWQNDMHLNTGIEGFTCDRTGKILAIAESTIHKSNSLHKAFYWNPNSNYKISFYYKSDPEHRITSITHLKNNDILVVERLFKVQSGYYWRFILTQITQYFGIKMFNPLESGVNIKYVNKADINEGLEVQGQTLVSIKGGKYDRNYEGIAVQETAKTTKIFLITDNNFLKIEPNMLLEFEILGKIERHTQNN